VGVISTEGTLQSHEYEHAIREANPTIGVLPKAAPKLVDLVEAGKSGAPETEVALRDSLADLQRYNVDTLILGCTHYPLLRPLIQKIMGDDVTVVDSAETTAARVKRVLAKNGLDSAVQETARHQIYVTGSADRFTEVARVLFGQDLPPITSVRLELVEALSGSEGAA
jgi:glutamate racemase